MHAGMGCWILTRRGGNGVFVEPIPQGLPTEPKRCLPTIQEMVSGSPAIRYVTCAVATSYAWSEIVQASTPS